MIEGGDVPKRELMREKAMIFFYLMKHLAKVSQNILFLYTVVCQTIIYIVGKISTKTLLLFAENGVLDGPH